MYQHERRWHAACYQLKYIFLQLFKRAHQNGILIIFYVINRYVWWYNEFSILRKKKLSRNIRTSLNP
jgi:hypothetical protein